jgi:hypothetical protein
LKKYIKKALLFTAFIALLYGAVRLIDITYSSYVFVEREPYMVMQTNNSITIKWQSPKEEMGEVKYGLSKEAKNATLADTKITDKHSLTISNLNECTKYFYSVESPSMEIDNEERSFTTLCQNAESQKLWLIGDSGKEGKDQTKVYKEMLKYIGDDLNNLGMWILLGDNAYTSGTQKEYNEGLFEPYKDLVKKFVPWAIIGNHDARRWAFYNIWDFPTKGESGGVASGHEEFYSINNGNLHLVMLDSETVNRSSDGAMASWLREDLKANTKPWVIVAFHTPPYTDGGHKSDSDYDSGGRLKEMRENFVPIFDEFGVDLVVSGHSHDYERSKLLVAHTGKSDTFDVKKHVLQDNSTCYTKPLKATKNSGTIYQVCGSSSKLDKAELKHPAMPFSFETMGSLILEITPTTLTSKFLTIDGKIADQFSINKDSSTCQQEKTK